MTLVIFSTQIRDLNSSLLLRLIHPLIIYNKVIALVTDQEFQNDTQMAILATLNGKVLSEYAVSSTAVDLGTFDISINLDTTDQEISFFPTFFTINRYDITTLSFSETIDDAAANNISLGNIVRFDSKAVTNWWIFY